MPEILSKAVRRLVAGLRGFGLAGAEVPGAARTNAGAASAIPIPSGTSDRDFIEAAFWIVLGKPPADQDRRDLDGILRARDGRRAVADALLSSTEFRIRCAGWNDELGDWRRESRTREALERLGDAGAFVDTCYDVLLGRAADPEGRRYYVDLLAAAPDRLAIVRSLARSAEFNERYTTLCPQAGRIPRDVQLCELANPAKWDNQEWMALLRSVQVLPADPTSMHRKTYEYIQCLFGLQRLGRLREDARVLSVGAGHECILYWLANHVGSVVAVDRYAADWQSSTAMEGDAAVLTQPHRFAPFAYRQDRLAFLRMDGRRLAFREATFHIAYSLSSIEHFDGIDGARLAIAEMARVLKPGGLLVLATECAVAGPPAPEVFQPDEVRALIDAPGLRLIEPIDDRVWRRYEAQPVDLERNPFETPHMIVRKGETVFTSVMVFLERG